MCGWSISTFVVGAALIFAIAPLTDSEPGTEELTEGTVVSAKGQDLVMNDVQGRRHAFLVGESAKVIIYGKPGKIDDLKRGTMIRVTSARDGRVLAVETVRGTPSGRVSKSRW